MLQGIGLRVALTSFVLSITFLSSDAFAQSGSVGGQIGKDNKSVSGSVAAPRTVQPPSSTNVKKPKSEPSSRAPKKDSDGGGAGSFDGAWVILATCTTCGSSSESIV